MKVNTQVLDVQDNMTGKHIGMKIAEDAMAFIMDILSGLYSDTVLAIMREYSTNAWDAHVEAGVKRPIEVTLPSPLAAYFKVRDYGHGLDVDDVEKIFSQYGASTKRDSDEVVGMLGLGSKSGWTYSDQFTVTSIKNGVKIQMSLTKTDDGTPEIVIVDERPTDEPSGVEIMIPANPRHEFEKKANDFFKFWEPGSVLVNGKEPEHFTGVELAPGLYMTNDLQQSVVVMGNVPYPMLDDNPHQYFDSKLHRYVRVCSVAYVGIGAVDFAPSREALKTTAKTKAALAKIREQIKTLRDEAFQRQIDNAKDRFEAIKVYHEVYQMGYKNQEPTYKGEVIPLKFTAGEKKTDQKDYNGKAIMEKLYFKLAPGRKYRGRGGRNDTSHTLQNIPGQAVWIENFDATELSPYKRQKLDIYVGDIEGFQPPEYYVLVNKVPKEIKKWVKPEHIFDWNVINKVKIVREKTQTMSGRPTGSYAGFVDGAWSNVILAQDIDTSKPIFYEHGSVDKYYGYSTDSTNALKKMVPNCTIIVLGGNRIAKFRRDFPQAQEARDYLMAEAKKWEKTLTADEKLMIKLHGSARYSRWHEIVARWKKFDPQEVNDPELKKVGELARLKLDPKLHSAWNTWCVWGASIEEIKLDDPTQKYPLLTEFGEYATFKGTSQEHLHIYLNAAFEVATQKEAQ